MPTYKKVIHADDNISELNNNSGYLTSVATANIGTGAVTAAKIASSAITVSKLASQAVNSTAIKDEAVTGSKIEPQAVDSTHIAQECINDAAMLASNVVTSAKIASSAITTAKLGTSAVTNAKLANDAVDGDKLASGAINHPSKFANSVVGTDAIANDSVTNAKIADEAIDNNKLADDAVTSSAIAANAVGNSELASGAVQYTNIGTNAAGSSGSLLGVAGGGTGLFWATQDSLAQSFSTNVVLSKAYMHFCHNFYDDIGTTTHYLPWNTGNETTTTLSSNSSFLVADTMQLKKIMIRPMQFQSFANYTLTVRVYKASNNSSSFTQQAEGTMSFNQYSNYGAQTITSMTPTVVSGEHIAIYIDASSDPGGTIHWQATTIWEVDRIGL